MFIKLWAILNVHIQLRLLDPLDIFKHFLSKSEWEDIDKTNSFIEI